MEKGEKSNSASDTGKSFQDIYGSWDSLQDELAQQKQAKAEAEAAKKREIDLAKGEKKFDKAVRDAIHKGDKVAFDEMMERDEHYRRMEMGENRVESEQPYEISTLSKEELDQAVGASSEIQRMNSLAKMIQNAESEEAKNKYRQQLIEASNEFSKGEGAIAVKDWHDQAQWDFRKASEAEGFRQKVLDTIWENAMAEPEAKKSNPDNTSNEVINAEIVGDDRLDEIREQFIEAVRNGASGSKLAQIKDYFYREALRKNLNNGKGELKLFGDDARDYENMEKVVSAIQAKERESQNKLNQEQSKNQTQDPENLGNFKKQRRKFGKFVKDFISNPIVKSVFAVTALGVAFFAGRVTADNNDSYDSYEPKIEHINNDSQFKQDKSKYDDAIKDVIEHNKDTEKNLEGYNAGKDIYETEKPQKEYLEDFASSREGLSTEDYRNFLMNEASTNPIMMLTKLDHAGLIPEFLDQDGDGDISDEQLHEIADKMAEDPALFKKVQDYYKKAVENAIIGEENEISDTFDSEYITKDANGKQRLAHSKDLNIGGKMRLIQLRLKNADGSFKNGKSYNESTKCTQGVTIKSSYNFNSWVPRGDEIKITPNIPTPDKPNNPGEETPPPTPDKPNNPGEETPPPTPDTPKELEQKDWSKQKAGDEVTPMDKGEFREDNSTRSSELDYTYKATPQIGQETPNLGIDYGNTYNGQRAENQYNPNLEQQDAGIAGQSAEIDRQNQEAAAHQAETDKAAENIQNPNRVTLEDGTVIDLPPTN